MQTADATSGRRRATRTGRTGRTATRATTRETWGAERYGDPCRECGFDWTLSREAAVELVGSVPQRFGRLLDGRDGAARHPELTWSAGAYVCHVGDNLRIWAERLAGAALGGPADAAVGGYDQDALAVARDYDGVPVPGALWTLEHAVAAWQEAVRLAVRTRVVLDHATRGEQRVADVARNNAHDAYHHLDDVRRILDHHDTVTADPGE